MSEVARGLAGLNAGQRTVPVLPALAEMLPAGALRRGSVVVCSGSAATTLAAAMVVEASRQGSWVGIAGLATLGLRMLDELGVDLGRVMLVSGPLEPAAWADALVALIDGFDVVLADGALPLRPAATRKLHARLQARGAVLVVRSRGAACGFIADVHLSSSQARWIGLGEGHGIARARQVTVEVHGRRVARPQESVIWLPADDGAVEPAESSPAHPITAARAAGLAG